jgi:hypothetical protein
MWKSANLQWQEKYYINVNTLCKDCYTFCYEIGGQDTSVSEVKGCRVQVLFLFSIASRAHPGSFIRDKMA